MSTLVMASLEEAVILAEQAMEVTREVLNVTVEEMVTQSHHVLLFQEGQEDLAHLALQCVTRTIVDTMAPSNPTLDSIIVLDSTEAGWSEVAPGLAFMFEDELQSGFLHSSQSIIAFGSEFLHHGVVHPLMKRATRFYAAIQDGPEAEMLIKSVHPLQEVVVL